MRKRNVVILIAVALLTVSFASASEKKGTQTFSPPTWLIGSWVGKDASGLDSSEYKITASNVYFMIGELEFPIELFASDADYTDATKGDVYTITFSAGGKKLGEHKFEKKGVAVAYTATELGKAKPTITLNKKK